MSSLNSSFCSVSKTTTFPRAQSDKKSAVFCSSFLSSSSSTTRASCIQSQRGSLRTHRRFSNFNALKRNTKTINEGLLSAKARTVAMSSSSSNDEQDVKDVQITLVDCFADENDREKMTSETRRNARESIMELENARFDALRKDNQFVLVEIFKGKEALSEHKSEPHYKNWNKNVESLMSKPRAKRSYTPVFPTNEDWNRVNTPLQIDENGQQIEVLEGSGTSVACHVTITVHKTAPRLRRFRSKTRFPPSSKRTAGVYDLTFSKEFLAKKTKTMKTTPRKNTCSRKSSGTLKRKHSTLKPRTRKTGKPKSNR